MVLVWPFRTRPPVAWMVTFTLPAVCSEPAIDTKASWPKFVVPMIVSGAATAFAPPVFASTSRPTLMV